MRIGIDLLWVRVGICGGTESYIRNLIRGFMQYGTEHEYVLFAAEDNAESFRQYTAAPNVSLCICPIACASQFKRILWENLHLDNYAKEQAMDVMFIPVYSKPHTWGSKIPYVSVIHDLQALHYPEYFSAVRRIFLKYSWKYTCKTSEQVITISDYCKEDLIRHYPMVKDRICTIYNPILSKDSSMDVAVVEEKYGILRGQYFYCVSAMLPHKNLSTILKVMGERKKRGMKAVSQEATMQQEAVTQEKLVLSGVGSGQGEMQAMLKELDIEDLVILTGFVQEEERDCLYENCKLFLFPSIFEGFGMPPIEAMRKGKRVVMTRKSCLEEVTEGKAVYVNDPLNVEEWIERMEWAARQPEQVEPFEKYALEYASKAYLKVLEQCRK